MPAYRVCGKTADSAIGAKIVIANTSAQAMGFIAEALLECETLGAQEVAELVTAGVAVVDSRAKPVSPPVPLGPSPGIILTSGVAAVSSTLWVKPGGEVGEMFMHKAGCAADPWTPIAGKGCRCTSLELPATGEGIAS